LTRNTLPTRPDHPGVSWSSWLVVAAVVLAVGALFGPPPFNGISLAAVLFVVLALVARFVETIKKGDR
jgi:membrane protein implicated in regulation of membrane protease activity